MLYYFICHSKNIQQYNFRVSSKSTYAVQMSFWDGDVILFRLTPRSGIAGTNGISVVNFLRSLQGVFHSGCTSLHSHQQWIKIVFSPHRHQHLLSLVLWIITFLTVVIWNLTMVLVCVSLVVSDGEHHHVPVGRLFVIFGTISIQVISLFLIRLVFCYCIIF